MNDSLTLPKTWEKGACQHPCLHTLQGSQYLYACALGHTALVQECTVRQNHTLVTEQQNLTCHRKHSFYTYLHKA